MEVKGMIDPQLAYKLLFLIKLKPSNMRELKMYRGGFWKVLKALREDS